MINQAIQKKEPSTPFSPANTLEGLFKKITKLDEKDLITKSKCKFCVHPARAEAEEEFEKTHSFNPVNKVFADYRKKYPDSPKMNPQNVRNHLLNHYAEQEQRIWKREYAERIVAIINHKIDMDRQFEGMVAILQENLLTIAAHPELDLLKKSDTITKIVKQIVDIGVVQAKMRGELKAVPVIIEKFQAVWGHIASQTQNNPVAHEAILHGLDAFQSEMEGVHLLGDKE